MKMSFKLTKSKNKKAGIYNKTDISGLSCVNENLSRPNSESVLKDGSCYWLNLKLLLNKDCIIKHAANFKIKKEVARRCSMK